MSRLQSTQLDIIHERGHSLWCPFYHEKNTQIKFILYFLKSEGTLETLIYYKYRQLLAEMQGYSSPDPAALL
jgi:hypothetical protein